jgi:hypothetical protein
MDALELESAKQSPAIETAKDLFSGAVGGIAQVLIGMSPCFFRSIIGGSVSAKAYRRFL